MIYGWPRSPLIVERAFRRERDKQDREIAKLEDLLVDPRRNNIDGRIEPLIENDDWLPTVIEDDGNVE